MKEEIKIAIFGLSLNVLDNIKQKLGLVYGDSVKLHWANIADPQLDILLVNDMFFSSPTIQSLVGSKRVPYLRLVNDSDKSGLVEGDVLYLPFALSDGIKTWFNDRYLKVPVKVQPVVERVEVPKQSKADYSKVIEELLNDRNGNVQVFDSRGNIAIVNIKTEQVWVNPERNIKSTDATFNFTYATMQMTQSVSAQQGLDLRAWLWNTLWFSPSLDKDISSSTYYKLDCWPQPDSTQDRQEIFKLAACFEKGANVNLVEKKTSISKDVIKRFVSVSLLAKAMVEISENEAKLKTSEDTASAKPLRSFFGSLRKKLGL
jgi:hypothetical protein